jgi:hypothetical protein
MAGSTIEFVDEKIYLSKQDDVKKCAAVSFKCPVCKTKEIDGRVYFSCR